MQPPADHPAARVVGVLEDGVEGGDVRVGDVAREIDPRDVQAARELTDGLRAGAAAPRRPFRAIPPRRRRPSRNRRCRDCPRRRARRSAVPPAAPCVPPVAVTPPAPGAAARAAPSAPPRRRSLPPGRRPPVDVPPEPPRAAPPVPVVPPVAWLPPVALLPPVPWPPSPSPTHSQPAPECSRTELTSPSLLSRGASKAREENGHDLHAIGALSGPKGGDPSRTFEENAPVGGGARKSGQRVRCSAWSATRRKRPSGYVRR